MNLNENIEDNRMSRLKSTLKGRLLLLNMFGPIIDNNYIHKTVDNIDVDIQNEFEIVRFLQKSSLQVNKLSENITNFISKNGTRWQKNRILLYSNK
jgi:hypothetical protein